MEKILFLSIGGIGMVSWYVVARIILRNPNATRKLFAGVLSSMWGAMVFIIIIVIEPIDIVNLVFAIMIFIIHVIAGFPILYIMFDWLKKISKP